MDLDLVSALIQQSNPEPPNLKESELFVLKLFYILLVFIVNPFYWFLFALKHSNIGFHLKMDMSGGKRQIDFNRQNAFANGKILPRNQTSQYLDTKL